MGRELTPTLRETLDWPLVVSVVTLAVIGVANLYSATYFTSRSDIYITQLYWIAFGAAAATLVAAVDYRVFERYSYLIFAVCVVTLMLVLLFGREVHGSKRWLDLFFFKLQPSEPMKLILVLALAKYLHNDPRTEGRTLKDLIIPGIMTSLPVLLVLRQPDLGTAMILCLIFATIMIMTRLRLRSVLTLGLAGVLALPVSWAYLLHDYQQVRILSFLDPDADPLGSGWHLRQSLVAIGSGGLFGKGFMGSTQNRNAYLPFQDTDFPFPIFCEEHGFFGAVLFLSLFMFLVLWCVRIGQQARDRFGVVVAVGVASLIFWQVVINMGMVTGLLPVSGVALPMISYGGSSLLTVLLGVGLVLNISMQRHAR